MKKTTLLLVLTPLFCTPALAANNLMKSGQWQDSTTGLIWARCSLGQNWTGNTCEGKPLQLKWQEITQAVNSFNAQTALGKKDTWRLPSISELSGIRYCNNDWRKNGSKDTNAAPIVEQIPDNNGKEINVNFQCAYGYAKPTINTKIFPNTPKDGDASFYWSATPFTEDTNFAWGVHFGLGINSNHYKYLNYSVRLVRDK